MPNRLKLTGLVAATFTPLRPDGSLNPEAVTGHAKLLDEAKVSGVFVCGTTGECHSLSVAERCAIAEQWVHAVADRMPVVVHVGHHCLPDAQALAAHAARTGATAIAALAPSYFKPQTVDDLVDFCAAVASAAPALPFYFYHIPSMTGVSLPMADFLRRGSERIPSLAGLKFTHNDLMMLQECLAVGDGAFDVVHGYDETLLAGLALGVRGAVGSTYNFAAPVYHAVLRAFEAGDLAAARKAQRRSVEMVRVLIDFGTLRAAKAIMAMLGVDCGPVRLPLRPLSPGETQELYERLRPLDIFTRPLRKL
jgi:N-acetylneuraminate lyase